MLDLKKFVQDNRPESIKFSLEDIRRGVEKLPTEEGWQVVEDPRRIHDALGDSPKDFLFAVVRFTGRYVERKIRGGVFPKTASYPEWVGVVYKRTPTIQYFPRIKEWEIEYCPGNTWDGEILSCGGNPFPQVLTELGVAPVVVQTPERVVKMPIPSWVRAESDDMSAWPTTVEVFESQAKVLWDEFLSQRPF